MQIGTAEIIQILSFVFNLVFALLLMWLRAELRALNIKIEMLEREISKLDEITEKLRSSQ